jgi:hypothetical protein
VEASPVYVIAFKSSDTINFLQGIQLIVNPLSPTVWLLVVATVLFISVTFTFQGEANRTAS